MSDVGTDPSTERAAAPDHQRCPRCGDSVSLEFYGPCDDCRADLRARFQSETESSDHVAVEYEPKMNVTPNAVALKDD